MHRLKKHIIIKNQKNSLLLTMYYTNINRLAIIIQVKNQLRDQIIHLI